MRSYVLKIIAQVKTHWTIILRALCILFILPAFASAMHRFFLFDFADRHSEAIYREVRDSVEQFLCTDYVTLFHIYDLSIDADETERMLAVYRGSDFMRMHDITDEYLNAYFLAVRVRYCIDYTCEKTFEPDGFIDRFLYLLYDAEQGKWIVLDMP